MKKTILIAAMVCFFGLASYAQKGNNPNRQDFQKRTEAMYDSLGLNKDQRAKMNALNDENRKQMMEIRNDGSLSDDQRRAKMEDLRKDQNTKREAILTPEQVKKYDEMMQNMRRNRPQPQRNQ